MAVNNRRIVIPNAVGTTLDIPIEQTWDFQGLQESIEQYELSVLEQVINKDEDFEVTRFAHAEDQNNETSISYIFNFWNPNILGVDGIPVWIAMGNGRHFSVVFR